MSQHFYSCYNPSEKSPGDFNFSLLDKPYPMACFLTLFELNGMLVFIYI